MKLNVLMFAVGMFAYSGVSHAKADKAQCEKAMSHMYQLAGVAPNDEARKNNVTKCVKEQSKAALDCILAAATYQDIASCKGKQ
jgi:hypothetical protein